MGDLPQGGLGWPNAQRLQRLQCRRAAGLMKRDGLRRYRREMRWGVDGRNRAVTDEPRLTNGLADEVLNARRTRRDLPRRQARRVPSSSAMSSGAWGSTLTRLVRAP